MTGALHVLEHHALIYRRTWKGSIFVSFLSPVLFLAAMGIGLGALIAQGPVRTVGGLPYLSFIAPGLLATATMQTAFVETTYPIMARIQWLRIYDAMLATPVGVRDLLVGEAAYLTLRLATVATIFFAVMAIFGTVHSALGLLAIPVAILTGLAFGAPVLAFTATQHRDTGFAMIGRFVITPLFLLGGAFFPIQQLPFVAQWIAWTTPLAHGVALARSLTVGTLGATGAIHLAVIVTYAAAGLLAASFTLQRRLVK
jgi:lipooligosaccharide transport system permease protein